MRRLERGASHAHKAGAHGGARSDVSDPNAAEAVAKAGWDPEGLFSSSTPLARPGLDLFAQREQRRAAAASASQPKAQAAPPTPDTPAAIPASSSPVEAAAAAASQAPPAAAAAAPPRAWAEPLRPAPVAGGVPGGEPSGAEYDPQAYAQVLRDRFMPVALQRPGLRVLHLDPPVIAIEGFAPPELCQRLIAAAQASGAMRTSLVGAGNASSADGNQVDQRRTSSSVLVDATVRQQHPELASILQSLQALGRELLDTGCPWGAEGRMPKAGQYCYESAQVACYTQGQHFLAHEDGFPSLIARANGFQRHATLLLYLNDVPQGGRTRFDHLGISVRPEQGKAVLFFPSFSNGRPDERTLHTAEDACETKWVMQQWVARGWVAPPRTSAAAPGVGVVSQRFVLPSGGGGGGGNGAQTATTGKKRKAKRGFGK